MGEVLLIWCALMYVVYNIHYISICMKSLYVLLPICRYIWRGVSICCPVEIEMPMCPSYYFPECTSELLLHRLLKVSLICFAKALLTPWQTSTSGCAAGMA